MSRRLQNIVVAPEGNALLTLWSTYRDVVYQVCSVTLCKSSDYFRNTTRHRFNESVPAEDGKLYFSADGFSPRAMTTLLHILHSNFDAVPRQVRLRHLVQMALILDYYVIHTEDVALRADAWIRKLYTARTGEVMDLPQPNTPDGVKLLFVSYALGQDIVFQRLSYRFMHATHAHEDDYGLPMVGVFDKIEACSQEIQQAELNRMFHSLSMYRHIPSDPFGMRNVVRTAGANVQFSLRAIHFGMPTPQPLTVPHQSHIPTCDTPSAYLPAYRSRKGGFRYGHDSATSIAQLECNAQERS
jgi:hypothetical protein